MKAYVCDVCGWVYDPDEGVPEMGPYQSKRDALDDLAGAS